MAQTSPRDSIPSYQIDLARPPELRYDEVARDFGPRMRSLQGLFDEILAVFLPIVIFRRIVKGLARFVMRRVYDNEEMAELKGIASATGVELHLLVILNNLLDCLLGCTSGAVLVKPSKGRRKEVHADSETPRLMHFRTLDWGMDGLRDLLVVLEYIDSSKSGSRVLARSVTYAGFVGSLTGVRQGLSLSLNFRPNHACSTHKLRRHQLMVLLGRHRSIGSVLRRTILGNPGNAESGHKLGLRERAQHLASLRTAPCFLILCDGSEVAVIEKDLADGRVRISSDFMVHTNHDVDHAVDPKSADYSKSSALGHEEWLEESTDRKAGFERKWERHRKRCIQQNGDCASKQSTSAPSQAGDSRLYPVDEPTLKRWVRSRTTMADCTHFACIMDPWTGQIKWLQRGPVPPQEPQQEQEQTKYHKQ